MDERGGSRIGSNLKIPCPNKVPTCTRNDFTEIGAILREPDTWNRVVKLAEALVVEHYMDNLDPYLKET